MNPNPGYQPLAGVLQRALDQAQNGKGAERHADGKPFAEQPMQRLCELYGVGFALGQAAKKSQESQRMMPEAAVRELLGAINYLAGAIIYLERPRPTGFIGLKISDLKPMNANDNKPAMICDVKRFSELSEKALDLIISKASAEKLRLAADRMDGRAWADAEQMQRHNSMSGEEGGKQ